VIANGGLEDMCNVFFNFAPPVNDEFRVQVTVGAKNSSVTTFELHTSAEELAAIFARAQREEPFDSAHALHAPTGFEVPI
jgi:hypothetical protein